MHPQLMTMFAEAQSEALRAGADHRRRSSRPRRSWRVFTLRRPRRMARVAHV
jgi:hypothetical protein